MSVHDPAPTLADIRSQLDQDEQLAQAATPGPWKLTTDPLGTHVENGDGQGRIVMRSGTDRLDGRGTPTAKHIARHHPERVLAEVAAKRIILAEVLSWRHKAVEDGWYSCSQATEANGYPLDMVCVDPERAGQPCDCGVERCRSVILQALAMRYNAPDDGRDGG